MSKLTVKVEKKGLMPLSEVIIELQGIWEMDRRLGGAKVIVDTTVLDVTMIHAQIEVDD
jgi:hypothetical protein